RSANAHPTRAGLRPARASRSGCAFCASPIRLVPNPRSRITADQVAQRAERAAEVALHFLAMAAVLRPCNPIRETRKRQRLHPDAAGTGHRRKEQPFSAEERRLDPADELDVVADGGIERHEAAGVHAQALSGFQLDRDDRAAAVDEHVAGAFEPLEDEAFAAEEARPEALGELDVDVDVPGRAQKRVPLAQHGVAGQRHPDDLSRVRTAERDLRARRRTAEEREKQALAREELALEPAEQ